MKNHLGSKRGTSLIEILVVMVVLLVGIMTVIRVFPVGFGVVKAAEGQTIATRLAQRELERWKSMPSSIPVGILPIDDRTGTIDSDQYPGPPFEVFKKDSNGNFITDTNGDYVRGNVLNYRQVVGETTNIPVGSYFSSGLGTAYGSRYTLAFSPIDMPTLTKNQDGTYIYDTLAVKGGDMARIRGNQDSYPPYIRQGAYAIDYGDDTTPTFYVAFPKTAAAPLYYLSYSYWVSNASGQLELQSTIDTPITLPSDYDGDWIPINITVPAGDTFVEMEDGSDSCARGFRPIQVTANFPSDDPYLFKLVDPILGVIAFNPIGQDMYEYTAQGVKPIIARIDYRIYDPRIIRDDRVVSQPDSTDDVEIPVKLSLKFILNAGDPTKIDDGDPTDNPDESTYEGLIRRRIGHQTTADSDLIVPQSLLIIDLATGLRVAYPNTRPSDATKDSIDYQAGTVYLPLEADLVDYNGDVQASKMSLAGRHLRFFYRADGDWAMQCQKAYALYTREWTSAALDYRHYGFDGAKRLLFSQGEAGKTVSVDYVYKLNDVEHKVAGEAWQISDDTTSGGKCYVDLNNLPAGATITRFDAIVGTSFRVRVVWREGTNWRHVDMDTSLLRDSAK